MTTYPTAAARLAAVNDRHAPRCTVCAVLITRATVSCSYDVDGEYVHVSWGELGPGRHRSGRVCSPECRAVARRERDAAAQAVRGARACELRGCGVAIAPTAPPATRFCCPAHRAAWHRAEKAQKARFAAFLASLRG